MAPHDVNFATLKCGSPDCQKRVPLTLVYCCDGCAEGLGHQPALCRGRETSGAAAAPERTSRPVLKMRYAFA